MNYITLSPIFGSGRSQWIFCFRAEHLCFSPWFREQFFSLKLVCGWFTVTHFVLAAGPTSKALIHHVVWAVPLQNLGLKLHWVWGSQADPWTTPECKLASELVCESLYCQSTSLYLWKVSRVVLLPVFPSSCSTFHHGLHVLLRFLMLSGHLLVWSSGVFFDFFFFMQNKKGWSVGWVCFPEACPCCTGRKIISHL